MIGTLLQHDSKARSSTARLLALFLGLGLSIHGLYYPQEWFLFGFVLSAFIILLHLSKRSYEMTEMYASLGLTDSLLLGLILASLLGVLNPVKLTDGFLEALQWGIFWLFYRLGVKISFDKTIKSNVIRYVEWLALAAAVIGWLPWVSKVGGRLSSVFGYSNATAVFLGAALLLHPSRMIVKMVLGISLLGTGSRAGVGLFVIVLVGRHLMSGAGGYKGSQSISTRQGLNFWGKMKSRYLRGLWGLIIGGIGACSVLLYYQPAWENLTAWGFSSSSWQERLVYFNDGIKLAWESWGLPQAGGWRGFPTVQLFPYWTADPHSSFIHILINQGIIGIIGVGIWGGYMMVQAWKSWGRQKHVKTRIHFEETKVQIGLASALMYMALHSLVDADFSFGSLGILFWLLFGCLNRHNKSYGSFYAEPKKLLNGLSNIGVLGLSIIICLMCGSALVNPTFFEREQIWNKQAVQWSDDNPDKSDELWLKSLKWDQTQVKVRRELAEHLLRRGDLDTGLSTVNEALSWQAFDLEAYEWAQSVVLEAAEENQQKNPPKAMGLYGWVEDVPEIIERRQANLNSLQQKLWPGHKDFLPSQHIKLLAEYARQRQLTQRLPQHKL